MENRLVPMRELLGELLLEVNGPAAALVEFETSLRRVPNRFRSFSGAARAAELVGDREKAKAYYAKLVALADQADSDRPELAHARAFLAK
jgi:predicted Zn-dependent protease